MNRVSHIFFGLADGGSKAVPLSYSASDAKNCMMNLARCSFPNVAKPEHLLLALYLRQPEMIKDFLGEIRVSDLSRKLLGYEIYEPEIEDLLEKPFLERPPVFISTEVSKVFNIAENIAKLIKHTQIGCAELFLAVLMVKSRTRINDVISSSGVNKTMVQRMFLETNLTKYDEEPDQEHSLRHDFISLN
jgi:ATP-dependent Clp protease ATP-binding subunit ClpA